MATNPERSRDDTSEQEHNDCHFGVSVLAAIEFAESLLTPADIANGYQVYDNN
jgi:hypothetical protein